MIIKDDAWRNGAMVFSITAEVADWDDVPREKRSGVRIGV